MSSAYMNTWIKSHCTNRLYRLKITESKKLNLGEHIYCIYYCIYYMNWQDALNRWSLWTEELSYSRVIGLDNCGSTIFGPRRLIRVISVINEIRQLSKLSWTYAYIQGVSRWCVNRDKRSFIHIFIKWNFTIEISGLFPIRKMLLINIVKLYQ